MNNIKIIRLPTYGSPLSIPTQKQGRNISVDKYYRSDSKCLSECEMEKYRNILNCIKLNSKSSIREIEVACSILKQKYMTSRTVSWIEKVNKSIIMRSKNV